MNNEWQDISAEMLNKSVLILCYEGEIEHIHLEFVHHLSYLPPAAKKWMPHELALKKLNAPLAEWQPIQSLPNDADNNTLIFTEDKTIFSLGNLRWRDGERIPRFPQFTHWCPAPSNFSQENAELKLYVGMYGKCRDGSMLRIISEGSNFFKSERFKYYANGKVSLIAEDPLDIIDEATKEDYIAYVTRDL